LNRLPSGRPGTADRRGGIAETGTVAEVLRGLLSLIDVEPISFEIEAYSKDT